MLKYFDKEAEPHVCGTMALRQKQCDVKLTPKTHNRWACRHARDGFRFGTELDSRQYTKGDVLTHRICVMERKNHTPTCRS